MNIKALISFWTFLLMFSFSTTNISYAYDEDKGLNAVKFPIDGFGGTYMDIIDAGPIILPRDSVFEVALPPKNDSEITKEELAYLKVLARTARTKDVIQMIETENMQMKIRMHFQRSGCFDAKKNAKTVFLLDMIDNDLIYVLVERKLFFLRPRPSQLAPDLKTVIVNPKHAAYPSGHAAQSFMVALVLSAFDEANADRYKQFANEIAHRREIAGVHYPSDSEAGQKLAVDVLAAFRDIPAFEEKFQAAKASYIPADFDSCEY